jgi:hypothetical protein
MKIQNILFERFNDDDDYSSEPSDLKSGYRRGEHQQNEHTVTVGNWQIKFKTFQETIHSPTRYSFHSPPEGESYAGDVKSMQIDTIIVPSANFDVPDLEYKVDFPVNKNEIHDFTNYMISYGDDNYEGADKDQYNKLIGYTFHNNPDTAQKIFSAMAKEANNVYKGEV